MISFNDIRITKKDDDEDKHVLNMRAGICITQSVHVDKSCIERYPEVLDHAEKDIRIRMRERIYGKVRDDARKSLIELDELMRQCTYLEFDTYNKVRELLNPFLNAGDEMVKES